MKKDSLFYPKNLLEKNLEKFKKTVQNIEEPHKLLTFIKRSGVLIYNQTDKDLKDTIYLKLKCFTNNKEIQNFICIVDEINNILTNLQNIILDILKRNPISIIDYIIFINQELNYIEAKEQLIHHMDSEMLLRTVKVLIRDYNHVLRKHKHLLFTKHIYKEVLILKCYLNIQDVLNDYIYAWMLEGVEISIKQQKLYIKENINNKDFNLMRQTHLSVLSTKEIFKNMLSEEQVDLSFSDIQEYLKESLYTDGNIKFKDISLQYWIQFWITLQKLASKKTNYIIRSKKQWVEAIAKEIPYNVVDKIFDYFVFSNKSIDLYDCPFIKIHDKYMIIPRYVINTIPSEALFSLFRVEQMSEINQKGTYFENLIIKILLDKKIKVFAGIKVNTKGETYEIDGGFLLQNTLFIIEAKTLKVPKDYPSYVGVKEALDVYYSKFERNFKFFTTHKMELIVNRLKVNKNQIKKIIPLFISNIPIREITINSILVTDIYAFESYFLKRPMNKIFIDNQERRILVQEIGKEYFKKSYLDKQFINFVKQNFTYKLNESTLTMRVEKTISDIEIKRYDFISVVN